MAVRSVWRDWCRRIAQSKMLPRKRRAAPRPWRAEVLEVRCLLSVITVTSLADNLAVDGKVTLREAIQAANTNASVDGSAAGQSGAQDKIVFQNGLTGTIKLNPALGELLITDSVQIVGLGAKNTVIDAQHNSRVFGTAERRQREAVVADGHRRTDDRRSGRWRRDSVSVSGRPDTVERGRDKQLGRRSGFIGRGDLHEFGGPHGPGQHDFGELQR